MGIYSVPAGYSIRVDRGDSLVPARANRRYAANQASSDLLYRGTSGRRRHASFVFEGGFEFGTNANRTDNRARNTAFDIRPNGGAHLLEANRQSVSSREVIDGICIRISGQRDERPLRLSTAGRFGSRWNGHRRPFGDVGTTYRQGLAKRCLGPLTGNRGDRLPLERRLTTRRKLQFPSITASVHRLTLKYNS